MTSGVKGTKPPHGNYGRYQNHGCRCDRCRAAWAEYHKENQWTLGHRRPRELYVAELRSRPAPHGTESRYRNRENPCRCDACREAANLERNVRRKLYGPSPEAVHGKATTYSSGCRCDDCRRAHTLYRRKQRRTQREATSPTTSAE